MTRFLMLVGAAAFLALPVAAQACPGHAAHTASAEASTVDLAAAAKKVLAPAGKTDNSGKAEAPAK